jgi:hypothetical protein
MPISIITNITIIILLKIKFRKSKSICNPIVNWGIGFNEISSKRLLAEKGGRGRTKEMLHEPPSLKSFRK